MQTMSYRQRRGQIQNYFDRTASDTWARLTSDAPVSRIRATVRAGRDRMRASLLATLPDDLTGRRVLDAGCGTGALAVEAARRGAHVVAIDIAGSLVDVARERASSGLIDTGSGQVEFLVGDMLDPSLGRFDHIVAMDSLIHYRTPDMVAMVASLAAMADRSVAFTFAPRTPLLTVMHTVGLIFPKSDRAPAIEPVDVNELRRQIAAHDDLKGWSPQPTQRIDSGFYMSEAMEIRRG
ncbi:MAG: magnesium protoporphyrin IX methyltransferase [Hyphomicrobium sp.]|nr:magnesium protoporphyrin IX methyltransferase [Hyphomicrobium sp.]